MVQRHITKDFEARQDLENYVEDLVEEKRGNPTYLEDESGEQICMDIISELCNSKIDGDVMSTEEITSFIALVVGGGGETSAWSNNEFVVFITPTSRPVSSSSKG